jgi:hypothetical protein
MQNYLVVGPGDLEYRIGFRPLSRKCGAIGPIDAQSVFVSAPYRQPIRAELIGSNTCAALGITLNGNTRFTFAGAAEPSAAPLIRPISEAAE